MSADVRMHGFTQRATVEQALAWIDSQCHPGQREEIPITEACGRVLAEQVRSDVDIPGFSRGMMDGFAVVAADTEGASEYNPLPLRVVGESLPGRHPIASIRPGEAVRIMTGAPLPEGADAVLPVEQASLTGALVLAMGVVTPGKHVGRPGEDIAAGQTLFHQGRRLRPQDIGLLASVGVTRVSVWCRPRVRIVVTGDELLPPGSQPRGYQIVDANSPMLMALARRDGALPQCSGVTPDSAEEILAAMRDPQADVVLVSGGSSVGQEDLAPVILRHYGQLAIHGIAMRPSSPTGMGLLDGRPVFLLPGNPVSCLCAYDFFAGRCLRLLGGLLSRWPYRKTTAPLARKIVSAVGRLDYARVRLTGGQVEPLSIAGASVLSSTTRADGFVVVPAELEGYATGTTVDVWLYD